MWFYDVFVCHASEDKDTFVRPLADRLRDAHLEVWYDEFSLKLGDSLRRSIDSGLARSRYGLVVLSHAFFEKRWPQRELDGLIARETIGAERVVLPIWHGVSKADVLRFSPPLADTFAADSGIGMDEVVQRILQVVRPRGSPLVVARDELLRLGVYPPVITDEWWLDVVEATNREPSAGFVSQRPHWERWTFPLPWEGPTPEERGTRLAWTALQMAWEEKADKELICQMTRPEIVLDFVASTTGLREMCHKFPTYLATYAPQLTLPGFGGEFEFDFDRLLEKSTATHNGPRQRKERFGSGLTTDRLPPACDEEIALRHESLGFYEASHLAGQYIQGDLGGPDPKLFETIDYIFWLLSSDSSWLPERIRTTLIEGTRDWAVWYWDKRPSSIEEEFGIEVHAGRGQLFEEIAGRRSEQTGEALQLSVDAINDIEGRAQSSIVMLGLPEPPRTLAERFIRAGHIEAFVADKRKQTQG